MHLTHSPASKVNHDVRLEKCNKVLLEYCISSFYLHRKNRIQVVNKVGSICQKLRWISQEKISLCPGVSLRLIFWKIAFTVFVFITALRCSWSQNYFDCQNFLSKREVFSPVHYSYRHGRHGGGNTAVEGDHLTGGNTRSCRESSKCRNYSLFVGQIIKYAPQIILTLMGPLHSKILTQMCSFNFFI